MKDSVHKSPPPLTGSLGSGCSADTMDVVFGAVGVVEVDDEFDVFDVDASRGHVGGDQHVDVGTFELVQNVFAFVLLLVTVNRRHLPSVNAGKDGERVGEDGLQRVLN